MTDTEPRSDAPETAPSDTATNAAPAAPTTRTDSDPPSEPDGQPVDQAVDEAVEGSSAREPTGFAALGLRPELLATVARLGYEEPTPIQRETIPIMLAGRDLLGQAATGTGKTAAFALPIIEMIPAEGRRIEPFALILVPTRELAVQVSEAIYRYGRDLGIQVLPIYGGQPIGRQLQALKRGVHVVVATPGRAVDHIGRGTLPLDAVEVVVLDEADEMLDMGFAEDIEAILAATPESHQTVLFSATMPPRIDRIIRRHLNDPARIEITKARPAPGDAPLVSQTAYVVARAHKGAALARVLDVEAPGSAIVFCRTRIEVDQVTEMLNGRGYRAEALHGGMSQEQRDRVMGRLRTKTADLLVATDVAARGLDIDQLTHVINYDVPAAPESYVHRIGRVGRAGREGVAITLAEPREQRLLGNIERLTKQKIAIQRVPSVADLRARQLAQTEAALRESASAGGLEQFDALVDALAEDFDIRDVALAAVKLLHEASGVNADEKDIPDAARKKDSFKKDPYKSGGSKKDGFKKSHGKKDGFTKEGAAASRGSADDARYAGATVKLWVGLGRAEGVRPKDLVGAIANETHLSGREIGPIVISENFSTVGVPSGAVDDVIGAMKQTTIKGKKAKVRRDRVG
jgi:ATP-dependent RNA helicase DeaD